MPSIYFLPGYLGSELSGSLGPLNLNRKIWVDYSQLGSGQFIRLKLDSTGKLPDPTFGIPLTVGAPLADYFGPCLQSLVKQFTPLGWKVIAAPYDWRLDIRTSGQRLANLIQAQEQAGEPCTLVGHSMGGLVARAAWYYLGLAGAQDLVRRIVTVATPHWGSYQTYRLMHGDEPTAKLVAKFTGLSWYNISPSPFTLAPTALRVVASVVNSWPSTYQLLPSLNDPQGSMDTNRALVYNPSMYDPSYNVNQALLNDAATTWQQFLIDPATQPPPNVLITVTGLSSGNVGTALPAVVNGVPTTSLITAYEDGDSIVPGHSSVLLTAGSNYEVKASHTDISNVIARSGLLATLITCKNLPPSAPNTPTLIDLIRGLSAPLFLTDEVVDDQPYLGIKAVQVPSQVVALIDLGPIPSPSRAVIDLTGVPQVIDHDC